MPSTNRFSWRGFSTAAPGTSKTSSRRFLVVASIFLLAVIGIGSINYYVVDVHDIPTRLSDSGTSLTKSNNNNHNATSSFLSSWTANTSLEFTPPLTLKLSELFQIHFPQCNPSTVLRSPTKNNLSGADWADQWISWLDDNSNNNNNKNDTGGVGSLSRARYVKTNRPPRYDHLSCFIMKARYNCAIPKSVSTKESSAASNNTIPQAFQHEFHWRHDQYGWDQPCNLNDLIDFVKGPVGVQQLLQSVDDDEAASSSPDIRTASRHRRPYQVLLQGNSFLRQVWEALVCHYRQHITNLTVVQGGPMLSLAYIESRSGKLITPQELGRFLPNHLVAAETQGCHGTGGKMPIDKFYWSTEQPNYAAMFPLSNDNVTVPPNMPKQCKDDMAMVEFANKIQFFFLFHPSRYNEHSLVKAYQALGLNHREPYLGDDHDDPTTSQAAAAAAAFQVDALIWTDEKESSTMRNLTANTIFSFERLLPLLTRTQMESIGRYFGANNPWILEPPDVHPCMPGIPDDEVNILLYLLLLNKFQQQEILS